MDLIYCDSSRVDIGIINSYMIDMAYGSDENNFICTVSRDDHCCEHGFFIYAENTEYGGVVDSISVNTEESTITYGGRTWHGILEGKVFIPPAGKDYLVFDGEAHKVLARCIQLLGLGDYFEADQENTEIYISNYRMDRYATGYKGIMDMLKSVDLKLQIKWINKKIILSVDAIMDYSQDEEFDESQINFTVERNYRPINHIVCLGRGELRDKAVIHVFADENGGIQDYATAENPVKDSDYILNTSRQAIFGIEERCEVMDNPNSEIVKNYVVLNAKPSDWDTDCDKYFTRVPDDDGEDDDRYETVKFETGKVYALLKKMPYDWDVNYGNYFIENVNETYSSVQADGVFRLQTKKPSDWDRFYGKYYDSEHKSVGADSFDRYIPQKSRPNDWSEKYGEYYYLFNDGVENKYKNVEGISHNVYKKQTQRPSDWSTRYSSYYRYMTAKEIKAYRKKNKKLPTEPYKTVSATKSKKAPTWKANTYYTKSSYDTAPSWGEKQRYTKLTESKKPVWKANAYYDKIGENAPTWQANMYFEESETRTAPAFTPGGFYQLFEDRYATLVKKAIEKLEEYYKCDSEEIEVTEEDVVYDIGDIVGTYENTTGISAVQEVTKKIITIENGNVSIEYEVS